MKDEETIGKMIPRFTNIVNGLEALGKNPQGIWEGNEDIEVSPIKVAYQGHRNSKSKRLD